MGCANSKQKRCRHCNCVGSPERRSYSMQGHDDIPHLVALTSSTLDSLEFDSKIIANEDDLKLVHTTDDMTIKEFSIGLIEAKTWSNMVDEKISKIVPKTPIETPPGEPETINTWELMEGLEDVTPFRSPNRLRSFSFNVTKSPIHVVFDHSKSRLQENGTPSNSTKPMRLQMEDDHDHHLSFDPEVISSFRKSLEGLPSEDPFHLRPSQIPDAKKVNGIVTDHDCRPISSNVKDKVVVYFTSLRGVRKTYEDCGHVRVILKSIGVRVDERDVSMHSGFKEELKELLGTDVFNCGGLPKVFVGKKYIGGADEIRRMHEDEELEKLFEGCENIGNGDSVGEGGCQACGDIRFVPCETCSGSCKVYYEDYEKEEQEEEQGEENAENEYGFQRCPDCNENGLIRCQVCCY